VFSQEMKSDGTSLLHAAWVTVSVSANYFHMVSSRRFHAVVLYLQCIVFMQSLNSIAKMIKVVINFKSRL
jgi:hypothetical protein